MKNESYLKFPFPPGYEKDIKKRFNDLPLDQQKNLINAATKIVDNFYGRTQMKEITIVEFRKDKHEAENSITEILNAFSSKYHCELKIDADVVNTNEIAVAKAFVYQAYLSAIF